MRNGFIFFGILAILAGVYFYKKATAPSTEAEPNNKEFEPMGKALATFFILMGLFFLWLRFFP